MTRYSFMYNWSSQRDGLVANRGHSADDCCPKHADRDQAGKAIAQVPVRLASRFALSDLNLGQQLFAPAFPLSRGPRDLGFSRDPLGLDPPALALLRRHSTGLRSTDSHGVKFLPPPFALNGEDCSGTV